LQGVPGQEFRKTLWWSFFGAAKLEKIRPRPEKKNWNKK
jgi:hypothetical protein